MREQYRKVGEDFNLILFELISRKVGDNLVVNILSYICQKGNGMGVIYNLDFKVLKILFDNQYYKTIDYILERVVPFEKFYKEYIEFCANENITTGLQYFIDNNFRTDMNNNFYAKVALGDLTNVTILESYISNQLTLKFALWIILKYFKHNNDFTKTYNLLRYLLGENIVSGKNLNVVILVGIDVLKQQELIKLLDYIYKKEDARPISCMHEATLYQLFYKKFYKVVNYIIEHVENFNDLYHRYIVAAYKNNSTMGLKYIIHSKVQKLNKYEFYAAIITQDINTLKSKIDWDKVDVTTPMTVELIIAFYKENKEFYDILFGGKINLNNLFLSVVKACSYLNEDTSKLMLISDLIDRGVDVTIKNNKALLNAVYNGNHELAKILLKYGADVTICGCELFRMAALNLDINMFNILINSLNDDNSSLIFKRNLINEVLGITKKLSKNLKEESEIEKVKALLAKIKEAKQN